jgi:hypothetical protein
MRIRHICLTVLVAALWGAATIVFKYYALDPVPERIALINVASCLGWDENASKLAINNWGVPRVDYGFSYEHAKEITMSPRGECENRVREVPLRSSMLTSDMPLATFTWKQSHYVIVKYFEGPDKQRTFIAVRDFGETAQQHNPSSKMVHA